MDVQISDNMENVKTYPWFKMDPKGYIVLKDVQTARPLFDKMLKFYDWLNDVLNPGEYECLIDHGAKTVELWFADWQSACTFAYRYNNLPTTVDYSHTHTIDGRFRDPIFITSCNRNLLKELANLIGPRNTHWIFNSVRDENGAVVGFAFNFNNESDLNAFKELVENY